MAGEICPIFERSEQDHERIDLIGAWMLHPQNLRILPEGMMFAELGHIAPMAAAFFRKEKHRKVPNKLTDVGNGCEFQNGAFVMGDRHAAPNEPNGAPGKHFDYVMKNNGGTIILIRSRKPGIAPALTQEEEAMRWFTEATARGGALSPKDFDIFELPDHPLSEWAQRVSAEPWSPGSCIMRITDVGEVTSTLYKRLSADHGIASSVAVELFDTYLGAACPKCFGGMNGSVLQQVGVAKSAGTYMGGGEVLHRILGGKCATCESELYHVIWHGDKNGPMATPANTKTKTEVTSTRNEPDTLQRASKNVTSPVAVPSPDKNPGATKAGSSVFNWIVGIVVVVVLLLLILL